MPTFGEDEREGSSGLDSRPASPVENLSAITSHPQTVQEVLLHLRPGTADVPGTAHLPRRALCLYHHVTRKLEPRKHI